MEVNDDIPLDMGPKRSKGITGNVESSTARISDQLHSIVAAPRTTHPKILSYKGVITRCFPRPNFGCYELDGKVRLYTVHQPCPYMGRGMRVGAEVSLYNVHPVKKGKELLGLCCCTLSSVRITKCSILNSEWKPCVFSTSSSALHGQNMSLQDYAEFTHACEKLLEKFSRFERYSVLIGYSSSRQKGFQDKVLKLSLIEKLLQKCNKKSRFPRQSRNIYEEFFDHPHTCCPTRNYTLDMPVVYTIEEVRRMALDRSKGLPWKSGVVDVPSGRDSDWMYQVIDSCTVCEKLVLLGYLRSSATTGYMKLYDQTGKIAMHVGSTQISCEDKVDGIDNLLDLKDCLIQVDKFDVVVETFQSCLLQNISEEKRTRIYIRTSFDSIEQLVPKTTVFAEYTKQNAETGEDEKSTTNQNMKCSIVQEQQNPEHYSGQLNKNENTSNVCSKEATVNVKPGGSREHSITCERPLSTCVFTCKLLFLVRHRENLQLKRKRRVMYACAVDVKVLAFSFNETRDVDVSGNEMPRMSLKNKSLVLRLQSEAVMFHPFLHDGCFYVLSETASNRDSSLAMRALMSSNRSVLNVSSSMDITSERLTKDHPNATSYSRERSEEIDVVKAIKGASETFLCGDDKIQSVEEVLNTNVNKPCDKGFKSNIKQVNFEGLIVRREMRQSDTCGQLLPNKNVMVPHFGALEQSLISQMELGYGYLGNKTLFLRIQDLFTPNTLDVYIDLSTAPYIDGLLPGTVVRCRRLLRKVSRNSNVYCSFQACSSLTVQSSNLTDQTSSQPSTSNIKSQNKLMSAVPNRYLIDLIEGESSGSRIHTISRCCCRVTAVQKVSMRWYCSKCGHVIEREKCPHGCRTEDPFRFCAEARCLVEDGTSEALVHLSDNMVSLLLRLSSQELSRLKSFAMSLGELVYQRYSYEYSDQNKNENANLLSKQYEASRLLTESCVAQPVRRSVILYCKPVGSINRRTDRSNQGYDTRPIIINQTEHTTFVLPKLQVKAINMTEVDYHEEIRLMLLIVGNLNKDDK